MLKLRLKRIGRKHSPFYRLVIIENLTRRNGRPLEEIGYYNPITKKFKFNVEKIQYYLKCGVKPTRVVSTLLKKYHILYSE